MLYTSTIFLQVYQILFLKKVISNLIASNRKEKKKKIPIPKN